MYGSHLVYLGGSYTYLDFVVFILLLIPRKIFSNAVGYGMVFILRMLFNTKFIYVEEHQWSYLTLKLGDKWIHNFPNGISPKVNIRERLEIKQIVAAKNIRNYDTGTLHSHIRKN